jgi:hypothetical protein
MYTAVLLPSLLPLVRGVAEPIGDICGAKVVCRLSDSFLKGGVCEADDIDDDLLRR